MPKKKSSVPSKKWNNKFSSKTTSLFSSGKNSIAIQEESGSTTA